MESVLGLGDSLFESAKLEERVKVANTWYIYGCTSRDIERRESLIVIQLIVVSFACTNEHPNLFPKMAYATHPKLASR